MIAKDIIRAWKDDEYRLGLSDEQRYLLPVHPAGEVELDGVDVVGYGTDPTCSKAEFICRMGLLA